MVDQLRIRRLKKRKLLLKDMITASKANSFRIWTPDGLSPNRSCRHSRNNAGITTSVSNVALTMPPTIGAAMRRMTSEPVPLPNMIGSRPPMVAATVMMMGRTRSNAPSITACSISARLMRRPLASPRHAASIAWFRYTSMMTPISTATPAKRNEADTDGNRQVVAQQVQQPEPADQRHRQRADNDRDLGEAAEIEIQQQHDDRRA